MPQGSGTCCKAFVLAESRRQTFLAGGGLARQSFPVRHATELCAEAGGSGWGCVSMVERSGASGLRFLFSVCKGARLDTCQQQEAGDRKPRSPGGRSARPLSLCHHVFLHRMGELGSTNDSTGPRVPARVANHDDFVSLLALVHRVKRCVSFKLCVILIGPLVGYI
jgi:hypothetical protein